MSNALSMQLNGDRRKWLWAVLGTVAMNIMMFSALPCLMHSSGVSPVTGDVLSQINLIRVKRAETPPRKTPPTKSEPQEQQPSATPEVKPALNMRLSLPFEINARLPDGPQTLALPEVTPGVLDDLSLNNVFSTGDLDRPLTALTRIPPVYPIAAKRRGIEGAVNIQFVVTETGEVEQIHIIDAKPAGIFETSVRHCVAAWRFKPGTIGGRPVKTNVATTIRFELE